jgi:hypothetical protein
MILNANKNTKKYIDTIISTVGQSYSIFDRFKMGGIGSSQLRVMEYSENLAECFGNNQDIKFVIIELRKNGLIIYIKNYINNYVWLVPYSQLSIFKSNLFSIHSNGTFVKIDLKSVQKTNKKFIEKMMQKKLEASGSSYYQH